LNGGIFFELSFGDLDEKMTSAGYKNIEKIVSSRATELYTAPLFKTQVKVPLRKQ